MLEYFYFNVTDSSGETFEVSLFSSMNQLFFRVECSGDFEYVNEGVMALDHPWFKHLLDLNFDRWKVLYWRNEITVNEDSIAWEISYKFEGRPMRSIKGDNELPEKWNDLMLLFHQLDENAHFNLLFTK